MKREACRDVSFGCRVVGLVQKRLDPVELHQHRFQDALAYLVHPDEDGILDVALPAIRRIQAVDEVGADPPVVVEAATARRAGQAKLEAQRPNRQIVARAERRPDPRAIGDAIQLLDDAVPGGACRGRSEEVLSWGLHSRPVLERDVRDQRQYARDGRCHDVDLRGVVDVLTRSGLVERVLEHLEGDLKTDQQRSDLPRERPVRDSRPDCFHPRGLDVDVVLSVVAPRLVGRPLRSLSVLVDCLRQGGSFPGTVPSAVEVRDRRTPAPRRWRPFYATSATTPSGGVSAPRPMA